eukprot:PhF_6_TR37577/c0_g2_i1/m.55738
MNMNIIVQPVADLPTVKRIVRRMLVGSEGEGSGAGTQRRMLPLGCLRCHPVSSMTIQANGFFEIWWSNVRCISLVQCRVCLYGLFSVVGDKASRPIVLRLCLQ